MNPRYREIHRAEISIRARNMYNRFGQGAYLAPWLAGFFCGFLIYWPVVLLLALAVVGYATKRTVEFQKRSDIWSRFVIGWQQHALLFSTGFAQSVLLVQGFQLYILVILFIIPMLLGRYNRKKYFRVFYINVARQYIREISALGKLET